MNISLLTPGLKEDSELRTRVPRSHRMLQHADEEQCIDGLDGEPLRNMQAVSNQAEFGLRDLACAPMSSLGKPKRSARPRPKVLSRLVMRGARKSMRAPRIIVRGGRQESCARVQKRITRRHVWSARSGAQRHRWRSCQARRSYNATSTWGCALSYVGIPAPRRMRALRALRLPRLRRAR